MLCCAVPMETVLCLWSLCCAYGVCAVVCLWRLCCAVPMETVLCCAYGDCAVLCLWRLCSAVPMETAVPLETVQCCAYGDCCAFGDCDVLCCAGGPGLVRAEEAELCIQAFAQSSATDWPGPLRLLLKASACFYCPHSHLPLS